MRMDYRCVVFDMDGVLFDSESLVIQSWEMVAQAHGIPHVAEICHRCLGANAAASKQMFLTFYEADFPYDTYKAEMSQKFWENVEAGNLVLKSGVQEILDFLELHHISTAIASSTRKAVIQRELAIFDLEKKFCKIIGGDQVHHSKPHPEIYQKACAALDVSPSLAIAIEDSYNGIRSAHDAGMQAIMIPDLLPPTEEILPLTAGVYPSLATLQTFLEGENQNADL